MGGAADDPAIESRLRLGESVTMYVSADSDDDRYVVVVVGDDQIDLTEIFSKSPAMVRVMVLGGMALGWDVIVGLGRPK